MSLIKFFVRQGVIAAAILVYFVHVVDAIPILDGTAQYVDYVSDVDGSTQTFSIYLPDDYDPSGSFPLSIHGYGYGGSASLSFPTSFADENDWILVNYDGRHHLQYDGVAEADLLQILDELEAELAVDPTRVYFEGYSMGSTGSMRMGFRHPDRFAAVAGGAGFLDYDYWYERWYAQYSGTFLTDFSGPEWRRALLEEASVVDIAENALHLPSYFVAGTADTVNRPENAINLDSRLVELGYDHTFVLVPGGGHGAGWSQSAALDYFLTNDWTIDPYVPDVVYKTNQLKYNSAYWVQIDRLHHQLDFALIETAMISAQQRIDVSTTNILQYTAFVSRELLNANGFDPDSPISIYTNGELSYVGLLGDITVYATVSGDEIVDWSTVNTLPNCVAKTHELEGPIGHAFMSRFRVVYGTSGSSLANDQSQYEAGLFVADWNYVGDMDGNITAVPDSDIDPDNPPTENLILFGTSDCNAIIDKVLNDQFLPFNVPLVLTDSVIEVSDSSYSATQYGVFMIYPNPLRESTYVVICHGWFRDHTDTPRNLGWDLQTLPWAWSDYVVFRHDATYDSETMRSVQNIFWPPAVVVEAGYFDGCWELAEAQSTPGMTPTPTSTPTYTATSTPSSSSDGWVSLSQSYASVLGGKDRELRVFRDRYLKRLPGGSALVDMFYENLPWLAECVRQEPVVRRMVWLLVLPSTATAEYIVQGDFAVLRPFHLQ